MLFPLRMAANHREKNMMSIKTGVAGAVLGWALAMSGMAHADVPT